MVAMEMRQFATMEEAQKFAKTVEDAKIIPEVERWTFDRKGRKHNEPTRVWVEYNFQ